MVAIKMKELTYEQRLEIVLHRYDGKATVKLQRSLDVQRRRHLQKIWKSKKWTKSPLGQEDQILSRHQRPSVPFFNRFASVNINWLG